MIKVLEQRSPPHLGRQNREAKGCLAIIGVIIFFLVRDFGIPYFINLTTPDVGEWLDEMHQQLVVSLRDFFGNLQELGLELGHEEGDRDQQIPPSATPSVSPSPTYIPVPTATPHVQILYIIAARQGEKVNGRECERLNCRIKIQFSSGDQICVIGTSEGDFAEGSNIWLIVLLPDGDIVYVNSALTSFSH